MISHGKFIKLYSDPKTNFKDFPYAQDALRVLTHTLNTQLSPEYDPEVFVQDEIEQLQRLRFVKYRVTGFQFVPFYGLHFYSLRIRATVAMKEIVRRVDEIKNGIRDEDWDEAEEILLQEFQPLRFTLLDDIFMFGNLGVYQFMDYGDESVRLVDRRSFARHNCVSVVFRASYPACQRLAYHLSNILAVNSLMQAGYNTLGIEDNDPSPNPAFALYQLLNSRITQIVRATQYPLPQVPTLQDVFNVLIVGLRDPRVLI